jgi:lipopolysaccharide transport system ATP-binding protein
MIISVENLGKRYSIRHQRDRYVALRDVIAEKTAGFFKKLKSQSAENLKSPNGERENPQPRTSTEEFWALRKINFEVKRGEVLGIIGRNGAGKTTLLKILSRITEPTEGRVRIRGRVASLLEVGTGFHPELTGRENIYLNGAILGMTKAEIKKKFDEIVAFAETEKFLDTPVKRYSSGMYVRLAFAVAAHLEPEILVVDEVLAVGDAEFQKKCLGKMESVATREGRTVLFVSHNMEAIRALCSNAINLDKGQIRASGTVEEVIDDYLRFIQTSHATSESQFKLGDDLVLKRLTFEPSRMFSGDSVNFHLDLTALNSTRIDELTMIIFSEFGARVAILDFRHRRCDSWKRIFCDFGRGSIAPFDRGNLSRWSMGGH